MPCNPKRHLKALETTLYAPVKRYLERLGFTAVCEIGGNGMGQINPRLIFDFIKQQYRPYDTHEEFDRGFLGLPVRQLPTIRTTADSISALGLGPGGGAAMRYQRVIAG